MKSSRRDGSTSHRVHFFGPLSPPHHGGIAQHSSLMVSQLRLHGLEVTQESWRSQYPPFLYKGHRPSHEEQAAVSQAAFKVRWWNPLDWWCLGRRARSADVMIQPWFTPFHGLPLLTSSLAARPTPTVLLVHGVETHEPFPFARSLTSVSMRYVKAALVHSISQAQALRSVAPHLEIETVQLPPLLPIEGSPLPPFPPYRLLFSGFVRPYKGLRVALEAVSILAGRDQEVELTVAGEFWDPDIDAARQAVADLGITRSVRLIPGYVSDTDLARLLTDSHIVLAPYLNATQSGLPPLAHAARRPVVASAVAGLAEQVRDGTDGILVRPGSAEDLAAGIQKTIQHLTHFQQNLMRRRNTLDRSVDALIRLIDLVGSD